MHTFDDQLVNSLPGIHAMSRFDSTSSFKGKGKVTVLEAFKEREDFLIAAALLGEN